jgi:hypothetical protein
MVVSGGHSLINLLWLLFSRFGEFTHTRNPRHDSNDSHWGYTSSLGTSINHCLFSFFLFFFSFFYFRITRKMAVSAGGRLHQKEVISYPLLDFIAFKKL